MPSDRSLAEWTRRVMGVTPSGGSAARHSRAARSRRGWDPDAPAPLPAEGADAALGPQDLSWFDSSLALARGLEVIEHDRVPLALEAPQTPPMLPVGPDATPDPSPPPLPEAAAAPVWRTPPEPEG